MDTQGLPSFSYIFFPKNRVPGLAAYFLEYAPVEPRSLLGFVCWVSGVAVCHVYELLHVCWCCLPTWSHQRSVSYIISWKTKQNFLVRRKTHRTCLHSWVTLRPGPLTACCKSEETGSLTSELSLTSIFGVEYLFSWEGSTCVG